MTLIKINNFGVAVPSFLKNIEKRPSLKQKHSQLKIVEKNNKVKIPLLLIPHGKGSSSRKRSEWSRTEEITMPNKCIVCNQPSSSIMWKLYGSSFRTKISSSGLMDLTVTKTLDVPVCNRCRDITNKYSKRTNEYFALLIIIGIIGVIGFTLEYITFY
ncbi:MAG: hypothetical protein EU543_06245, partial [Promethearchaeota archaeon]